LDDTHNPFIGDEKKFQAVQAQLDSARAKGAAKGKGESARKSALNADQNAWETNRLLTRCGRVHSAARRGALSLSILSVVCRSQWCCGDDGR
jgi:uncharacterized protein YecT (DUF1311 family)